MAPINVRLNRADLICPCAKFVSVDISNRVSLPCSTASKTVRMVLTGLVNLMSWPFFNIVSLSEFQIHAASSTPVTSGAFDLMRLDVSRMCLSYSPKLIEVRCKS
jgi:hypothetical protein